LTAKKLAEIQNIRLPFENDEELESLLSVPESCESLTEFLKCFALPLTLLQTKEGITEAVKLILDEKAEEGMKYIELRFAPQLHCERGLSQEDVVLAALEGLKGSKVHCNLILCCMRGEKLTEKNLETVRLAKKYLVEDGGVVALDLAGAEALFKTENFALEFGEAKKFGVPFTIHAGEADGWQSVKTALDFGAVRIGHGVRSWQNEELLKYIEENNIVLEMCPNSNRQTKAVEDMSVYPLRKFLEMGIKVTVNTDDPAICRTTLQKEFEFLRKNYGLTKAEEKKLLLNAIDAAFTTEENKEKLRNLIV
ncbi:MAG: adenosine deaminase, partial [Spirochaetia bacterium]|nr:adenosine deaminase [Spirochaetia bacterium]